MDGVSLSDAQRAATLVTFLNKKQARLIRMANESTSVGHQRIEVGSPFLVTWRRRLVGGPRFEKTRVVSWHIRTLLHQIPSIFGQVHHYAY
jgi:hypothetical protein